jgi:hypothetical protein
MLKQMSEKVASDFFRYFTTTDASQEQSDSLNQHGDCNCQPRISGGKDKLRESQLLCAICDVAFEPLLCHASPIRSTVARYAVLTPRATHMTPV